MNATLRQYSIRPQVPGATFGNGIQPVGVLPLVRRLVNKGDIA